MADSLRSEFPAFLRNVWILFRAPGTIVHELGHYIAARALGADVDDVVWFQLEAGLFGGNITLGRVKHSSLPGTHREIRRVLISMAPLFVSTLATGVTLWVGMLSSGALQVVCWYFATVFALGALPSADDRDSIQNSIERLPPRLRPLGRPIPAVLRVLEDFQAISMGLMAAGAWVIIRGEVTTAREYAILVGLIVAYPACLSFVFLLWRLATGRTSLAELRKRITNAEGQRSATFSDRVLADERSTEDVVEEALELLRNGRTGSYKDIALAMQLVHDTRPGLLASEVPALTEVLRSRSDTITRLVVLDGLLLVLRDPPAELTLSPEAVSTIAGLLAKEDERIRDRAIEALAHVELEGLGDLGDAAPALASLLTTGVPGDKPRLFIAAAGASRSRPHVFAPCTDVIVRYAREGATPTRIAALLMLSNLQAVSRLDAVRSIAETASNDDVASTAENTIDLLEDIEGLVTNIAGDIATDQAPDTMSG